MMTSIIRADQSTHAKTAIDEDSIDRIMSCGRALTSLDHVHEIEDAFWNDRSKAFEAMLQMEEAKRTTEVKLIDIHPTTQIDDVVPIR